MVVQHLLEGRMAQTEAWLSRIEGRLAEVEVHFVGQCSVAYAGRRMSDACAMDATKTPQRRLAAVERLTLEGPPDEALGGGRSGSCSGYGSTGRGGSSGSAGSPPISGDSTSGIGKAAWAKPQSPEFQSSLGGRSHASMLAQLCGEGEGQASGEGCGATLGEEGDGLGALGRDDAGVVLGGWGSLVASSRSTREPTRASSAGGFTSLSPSSTGTFSR